MSGRPLIYLDSCIFISWLKNEIRQDPKDMLGVEKLVNLFDMGQIDIVTSTITLTEVLESSIDKESFLIFRALFSRRNCHLVDVTREVAEISHQIRNFYHFPNQMTLGTPDCLHLATAIYYQCKTFYTFDGENKRDGMLLSLPNPIADKYSLSILKPEPDKVLQLSVLDFNPSDSEE